MSLLSKALNNISILNKARIQFQKRANYKKELPPDLQKVRVSINSVDYTNYIKLQTPDNSGIWQNSDFLTITQPNIDLVINYPNPFLRLNRKKERKWLIHMEPPGYIKKMELNINKLTDKFGRIYTSDPDLISKAGKFIASPPFVNWGVSTNAYASPKNVFDFDFLFSQSIPEKLTSLVAINSAINDLPGHKLRADFISRICEANINMELYGASVWSKYKQYKGRAEYGKWPVYSRSKYVLVIENEVADYYWSEKFTDALLCFCIPIYYGSPKINNWFPEGSYIPLDIRKKSAVDDLRSIIQSDFYERNIDNLITARNLVLTEHNLFSFMDKEVTNFLVKHDN
jgi:hypothetical protein